MIINNSAVAGEPGPRSLGEHAYELLVNKITRLELRPGTALAERGLVEVLGIGRTPIREALQRLSVEGLVCHVPHRGMYVCEINEESVQQIYEFRTMIDGNAARLAAQRATEVHIHELERLDGQLAGSIDNADVDTFVDADREFHIKLAEATQNIHIGEVMPRIFHQQLRLMFFISEKLGDWQQIARDHEKMIHTLVDAIMRHQPEEADLAMRLYLIRGRQEVLSLL